MDGYRSSGGTATSSNINTKAAGFTTAQRHDITIERKTNLILTAVKLSISGNSIRVYRQALYSLYFTEPVELKMRNCTRNPALSPFEHGSIGLVDDYFLRYATAHIYLTNTR
jgi:hypothetical protein